MNSRERIDAILHFEEPDRVGLCGSLWLDTIYKWGLKESSTWSIRSKMSEIYSFFPTHTVHRQPSDYYSPGYDEIVVEETDEWKIVRDQYGVKAKYWVGRQGVPHILDAPVQCLNDFKEKIETFMDPDDPRRVTSSCFPHKKDLEEAIRSHQRDFYVTLWLIGPFEICRHFVGGIPQLLTIMIKHPHFASYMFNSVAEYQSRVCETHIDAGVDAFFMGEDLGYRNGPFFSPDLYRKVLAPAHEKMCHPFSKRDMPCLIHSDGDVRLLIPDFLKVGITGLNPLEVKAGLDVRKLKKKYEDELAFVGGIDVRTLASGNTEDIEKEVASKISIAGQGGGFVVGPDHSIPPNVSLEDFEFFRKTVMNYGKYPLRKA